MKYLKEYAFWNKDSITADGIFKSMESLKGSEIEQSYNPETYKFNLKGFEISVSYDVDFLAGYFDVLVDDVKIDCSWNQGRKIFSKAKKLYLNREKEETEFIRKDAKIAFSKKNQQNELE